jgi:hypothetical protein
LLLRTTMCSVVFLLCRLPLQLLLKIAEYISYFR